MTGSGGGGVGTSPTSRFFRRHRGWLVPLALVPIVYVVGEVAVSVIFDASVASSSSVGGGWGGAVALVLVTLGTYAGMTVALVLAIVRAVEVVRRR